MLAKDLFRSTQVGMGTVRSINKNCALVMIELDDQANRSYFSTTM